jgi:hypothetical protein
MKKNSIISFLLFIIVSLSSCEKILGSKNGEQENITTLRFIVVEITSGVSSIDTFEFSDPDGPGGNIPTRFDTIRLETGKKYVVGLQIYDESKTPMVNMNPEIIEEGEEHQFFYLSNIPGFTITPTDKDANGNPIGLNTDWNTPNIEQNGTLQVILKHQPRSKATAPGNINAGETDVDVTFPLIIE